MMNDDDTKDRTAILGLDQETINRELQKAKEQPGCLILIRGTPQGHRFFITSDEMTIGRDPSADIMIGDPSISRKHAKVKRVDGGVTLEDLGSSNGTSVNGKKLESGVVVTLAKEDLIKLGNSIVKYLPAEVKRAKALSTPLTLIFFDLDHFKKVNDTYGHEGGDFVLKEFTNLVRTMGVIDNKDLFARYGGEEFCLLMPSITLQDAAKKAETIRGKIQLHSFNYEGKRIPVTTSLGVSELRSDMETATDLIKAADKALYESKEGGRNRVTVSRG
ncbi:MAG: GGDEF domain-containing protein [Proteobacteria bacterium]|nr:GGDEF domain-containing protein [Pseudomonadota bacterium]